MKDAYSFHATRTDLDAFYDRAAHTYRRIFQRLELPVLQVEADVGMMGGWESHEFMLLAEGGEDTLLLCPSCGYAANAEVAAFNTDVNNGAECTCRRTEGEFEPVEITELATPDATTIAALCEAVGCRASQTLKAVFYAVNATDPANATESELVLACRWWRRATAAPHR